MSAHQTSRLPATPGTPPGDADSCSQLSGVITSLLDFCRRNQWAGHDPYDALNSRVFQALPLSHVRWIRLAWTQAMKRSPLNFRPLFRTPEMQNPKGIALFASAAVKLSRIGLAEPDLARSLTRQLLQLRSPGVGAVCWGYPFDWQNRHFMLPRYQPNVICSTFGGNALLDAYEYYGGLEYLDAASSVADFILTGLNRSEAGGACCFSYTTLDRGRVHNANLLAAAFLARLWQHTKAGVLETTALRAARFTVDCQRADGSWPYGEAKNQQWVDGFHTGYNLVALNRLHTAFTEPWLESSVSRGFEFYLGHFFTPRGLVKYYSTGVYPLDAHSVAQGIITLIELQSCDSGALALAGRVLAWANDNMRSPKGYYYFQKHRWWTIRIPYMRWSQAWMLLALATLAEALHANREPASVNTPKYQQA